MNIIKILNLLFFDQVPRTRQIFNKIDLNINILGEIHFGRTEILIYLRVVPVLD